jgi:hypothetical protein
MEKERLRLWLYMAGVDGRVKRIRELINLAISRRSLSDTDKQLYIDAVDCCIRDAGEATVRISEQKAFDLMVDADRVKESAWRLLEGIKQLRPENVAAGRQKLPKSLI